MLEERSVHFARMPGKGFSFTDPFTGVKIKNLTPSDSLCSKEGRRIKAAKLVLRIAKVGGRTLERDVIGAINIGLKHLSDGSPMALGSTELHGVWVKLVITCRGLTPLMEYQTLLAGKC